VSHEYGLIRTERLDRLALRLVDSGFRRTPEQRDDGVRRLARLIELSGVIYLGMTLPCKSSSVRPALGN